MNVIFRAYKTHEHILRTNTLFFINSCFLAFLFFENTLSTPRDSIYAKYYIF